MPDAGADETLVREQLARYAAAVRASPHNLLSQRALDELETRHLPECVAFARGLPSDAGRLLDIGTGGGLPGLVVAIVRPELDVTLLDATRKKVAFVQETADDLGVTASCVHGRAEDLASGDMRASFDTVTARAVAPLERLVGWTAPFLRPGGVLHAIKGERWMEELQEALPALRRLRMDVVRTPPAHAVDGPAPLVVSLRRASGRRR